MAYPSFLPVPVREGYAAGPNQPLQRTLMDDGQYSQTRRWSSVPMAYRLTWKLTFKQAALFDAWIEYDCARGVGPMTVPVAGKSVTCKPISGEPEFRFAGGHWIVALDVIEYRRIAKPSGQKSLPTWPAVLPDLESGSFVYGKANSMTISDKQLGPSEARVRFRDRASVNTASVLLTLEQRDAFWDFYADTLLGGAAWFYGQFVNPLSQDRRRIRITEPPKESPVGALFSISLKIETVRAPIMTTSEYRENFELINDYVVSSYVEKGYVGYYQA